MLKENLGIMDDMSGGWTWGGGSGRSWKSPNEKIADQTKQVREEIRDVNSELKNYQRTLQDLEKRYESYASNAQKFNQGIERGVRDVNRQLRRQQQEFENTINTINSDTEKSIAQRLISIENEKRDLESSLRDLERRWVNASLASSIWLDTLERIGSWEVWDGQQVEDLLKIAQIQKQINDLKKEEALANDSVSQSVLAMTREYQGLNETEKILADQRLKQQELDDTFAKQVEKAKSLERIYSVFENIDRVTSDQLDEILRDERFNDLDDDERKLVEKLANEKIQLTQQNDFIIWLERKLNNEKISLTESANAIIIEGMNDLRSEYDSLISQINSAIQAQRELNRLKGSSNSPSDWFAEGGYTWDGGKYDVAWVVHKWEYVVPQRVLKNMPDLLPKLEAARQGNMNQDFSRNLHFSVEKQVFESSVDLELFMDKQKFRL